MRPDILRRALGAGLAASIFLITGCDNAKKPAKVGDLSPAEAQSIAKDAYIYGVPMVAQYKTMYAYSINKSGPQYMGPFDSILNIARVFTPADTADAGPVTSPVGTPRVPNSTEKQRHIPIQATALLVIEVRLAEQADK